MGFVVSKALEETSGGTEHCGEWPRVFMVEVVEGATEDAGEERLPDYAAAEGSVVDGA